MGVELTPEFAISYTKLTTCVLFTWPPSTKATRLQVILFQIGWYTSWIISVILLIPLTCTAYNKRNNFMELTELICIAVCIVQVTVKMLIGKRHYYRYQYLIEELELFVKNATPYEREVITDYIKRVAPFHYRFNMVSLIGTIAVVLGPVALPQPLPTAAEYPFPTDEHPAYDIVYLLETFGAIQCCCTGPFDCQACLLIWFATVRLKFLAEKMRNVECAEDLNHCIRLHQHLLWYISETIEAVRSVVAATIVLATISIACGAIHLVGNESVNEKIQFIGIDFGYSLELLCVAWATENMMTACEEIGWALYNSPWIKNTKEVNRSALFILQRCENAPTIAIGGLLPELSLSYYATYMSKTFSFFTTLRVMLMKFEDNNVHNDGVN